MVHGPLGRLLHPVTRSCSDVAAIDGTFVVVWSSGSPYGQYGGSSDGNGRALAVWGAEGGPFARAFERFARICGDADESAVISSTDALAALRGAVGLRACDLCTCDANRSMAITAIDALWVLKVAVGESVHLTCEPCLEPDVN